MRDTDGNAHISQISNEFLAALDLGRAGNVSGGGHHLGYQLGILLRHRLCQQVHRVSAALVRIQIPTLQMNTDEIGRAGRTAHGTVIICNVDRIPKARKLGGGQRCHNGGSTCLGVRGHKRNHGLVRYARKIVSASAVGMYVHQTRNHVSAGHILQLAILGLAAGKIYALKHSVPTDHGCFHKGFLPGIVHLAAVKRYFCHTSLSSFPKRCFLRSLQFIITEKRLFYKAFFEILYFYTLILR